MGSDPLSPSFFIDAGDKMRSSGEMISRVDFFSGDFADRKRRCAVRGRATL